MLAGSLRRAFRSHILGIALLLLAIWTFAESYYIHRTLLTINTEPVSRVNTEKIFIAALPWNNEVIFRTHLIDQILDLVHALGVGNTYISIYENGSYDKTKDVLRDLHQQLEELAVPSRIILDQTSHEDLVRGRPTEPEDGWIRVEQSGFEKYGIHRGDYALRRIHYLAQLRNRVLEPLEQLGAKGEMFDRILFLNDVIYSTDDVLNLLQTRNGNYAAACTLDFELPPSFYDTFALRDSEGLPALMLTWPFFRSAESRKAIIKSQPAPVQACWNGLTVFDAAPFYDNSSSGALRFRGVPDSLAHKHVEGSECCLVHADNPLTKVSGVWVNPNVRVGYCHPDLRKPGKIELSLRAFREACQLPYDLVHPASGSWIGQLQIAWGLWENRIKRWLIPGRLHDWRARRRLGVWAKENLGRQEVGAMCLVDEMHIIEPHGWLHI